LGVVRDGDVLDARLAAGQIAQHLQAHATATDEDWRPAFEKMRRGSAWLET
ncbi:MAG: hypothetical protein HKN26_15435, partial [Acidimicrobiales bacterium]|nr:hypothetical protein [Acidimicrobiales bacterium]